MEEKQCMLRSLTIMALNSSELDCLIIYGRQRKGGVDNESQCRAW